MVGNKERPLNGRSVGGKEIPSQKIIPFPVKIKVVWKALKSVIHLQGWCFVNWRMHQFRPVLLGPGMISRSTKGLNAATNLSRLKTNLMA